MDFQSLKVNTDVLHKLNKISALILLPLVMERED